MSYKTLTLIFFLSWALLTSLCLSQIFEPKPSIQVGLHYGVWFKGDDPNDWDGSWNYRVIDKPVLGYYTSHDVNVIKQHIAWFNELKLDFVFMQWRPRDLFINESLHLIFPIALNESVYTKFCILVEDVDTWGFEGVYDYVYYFVQNYRAIYYDFEGKPLIMFFDGEYLNEGNFPKDGRFTIKIYGYHEYTEWEYDSRSPSQYKFSVRQRQYGLIPRFDETNFPVEERPHQYYIDKELTWFYEAGWEEAINLVKQGAIDVITIASWNEYAERSNIEPHIDATALNKDPYYLFNLTKYYIAKVKEETLIPEMQRYKNLINYVMVSYTVIFTVIARGWMFKHNKINHRYSPKISFSRDLEKR